MKVEWSNIKGCGSIAVINNITHERLLNRVLTNTMKEFARHNVRFNKLLDDWIFYYNERQYASAMLPALLSECEGVFVEQAVTRKVRGSDPGSGRIDYWAQYNSKTLFLIELKQSYLSAQTGNLNTDYYSKWALLNQQLRSIRKKEIWNNLSTDNAFDIYKVGIQSAYVYSRKKRIERCSIEREVIADLIAKIDTDKRINADWIGAWYTTDKPRHYKKFNTHFHYPACIWIVRKERLKWSDKGL